MKFLLGALLALAAIAAHAETVPSRGSADSRVRVVAYNPDDVVKLKGYVGYQIDIQFSEGEEVLPEGIGIGDSCSGDSCSVRIGTKKNFFFIKPGVPRVSTNLTVLTNRRHYRFDYSALPKPQSVNEMIYSIKFIYPEDEAKQAAAALGQKRVLEKLDNARAERPQNLDYWYCGSEAIRPARAYDDGVHTYLMFPANAELPALFVKNDDDSESLVDLHVEADTVVVHRVARQFVARKGQLVGCIVNKGYAGAGARMDTGTVSADVERQTRGAKP